MNLEELGSTFKEILLTPPDHLSFEIQSKFQNILRHTSSPILFKLRSILDMMQSQISSKNYKTYSTLLRSLLETQDSLPGRISPDILEPVTDVHQLHPGHNMSSYDTIEITSGTSIWALYLKRELQEQNRVDQRQLKSVIVIKFVLLSGILRSAQSAFLDIFYCKNERKFETLNNIVKALLKNRHFEVLNCIIKNPEIKQGEKRKIKEGFKIISEAFSSFKKRKLEKFRKSLPPTLGYYSNTVSIFPDKESVVKKKKEIQNTLNSKNQQILISSLKKIEMISKRANFSSFARIKMLSFYLCHEAKLEKTKLIGRKNQGGKAIFNMLVQLLKKNLSKALKLIFSYKSWVEKREKVLKTLKKFLKFRLLDVIARFSSNIYRRSLLSNSLFKALHNISVIHTRACFESILSFPEHLLKKGFDAFTHNFFRKNIEKINSTWKMKLNISENKWKTKKSIENSRYRSGNFFDVFCKNFRKKLLRHSFQLIYRARWNKLAQL